MEQGSNRHWTWSKEHPKKVKLPKEKIEQLYSEGKTMQEIAKTLKTTKRVVHLRMQEYGIKRRKMIGAQHGSWKGGRVKLMEYIAIWMPEHPRSNHVGYVKEHILIMEKKLGRHINKDEHIHHIDFDRQNNDINNLWMASNKKHHAAQNSIFKIIKPLLKQKAIIFDTEVGEYVYCK